MITLIRCVLPGDEVSGKYGVYPTQPTHRYYLDYVKPYTLIDLLYKRSLKFVYRCLNSRSFIVNFIARHSILFCRMNSIIGRNVLGCCQLYNTKIESVVTCRFDIKNIDRTANTASDDVCNRVAMLNELIQCTDGMLWLSDVSFTSYDIEQLIYLLCTS